MTAIRDADMTPPVTDFGMCASARVEDLRLALHPNSDEQECLAMRIKGQANSALMEPLPDPFERLLLALDAVERAFQELKRL